MTKTVPLLIPFLLALLAVIIGNVFLPTFPLFAFAPFLAIVAMRKPMISTLWFALACGLVIDLTNTESRFGWYALTYTLTMLAVHAQKRHFFDDKPLSLSIFTVLISMVCTAIQMALIFGIRKKLPFSWGLFLTDLSALSVIDGIYAFAWFTCPFHLYKHLEKKRWWPFAKQREVDADD